jgi:excisionase family DNA binding protein
LGRKILCLAELSTPIKFCVPPTFGGTFGTTAVPISQIFEGVLDMSISQENRDVITGKSKTQPELITLKQLASTTQIHEVSLRRWLAAGLLPHYRFGRAIRFRLDEVLEATKELAEGGAR